MADARLHPVFTDFVNALRRNSAETASSLLNGTPSDWFTPSNVTNVTNPGAITPGFDREPISSNYERVLKADDGTVGQAGSLKLQLDVLGAAERAFRLRHASMLRCAYHGAARLRGHGDQQGPIAYMQQIAQDILKAGS